MADINNQNGVFGGVEFNSENNIGAENTSYFDGVNQNAQANNVFGNFALNNDENNVANFQPIGKEKAITEKGLWSRIKAFLFQEIDLNAPIKVELTPYQQKVEDEINEFLHQEVSFKGIVNFFKGSK